MLLALRTTPCHESKGSLSPARGHRSVLESYTHNPSSSTRPKLPELLRRQPVRAGRKETHPIQPSHSRPPSNTALPLNSLWLSGLFCFCCFGKENYRHFFLLPKFSQFSALLTLPTPTSFSSIKDSRTGPSQPLSPKHKLTHLTSRLGAYSPHVAFLFSFRTTLPSGDPPVSCTPANGICANGTVCRILTLPIACC